MKMKRSSSASAWCFEKSSWLCAYGDVGRELETVCDPKGFRQNSWAIAWMVWMRFQSLIAIFIHFLAIRTVSAASHIIKTTCISLMNLKIPRNSARLRYESKLWRSRAAKLQNHWKTEFCSCENFKFLLHRREPTKSGACSPFDGANSFDFSLPSHSQWTSFPTSSFHCKSKHIAQ